MMAAQQAGFATEDIVEIRQRSLEHLAAISTFSVLLTMSGSSELTLPIRFWAFHPSRHRSAIGDHMGQLIHIFEDAHWL
jgi:hypothetical protein